MNNVTLGNRGLWLLIFVLGGMLVGTVAAIVASVGGANVTTAIFTGGGAVAGTIALALAAANFLSGRQE